MNTTNDKDAIIEIPISEATPEAQEEPNGSHLENETKIESAEPLVVPAALLQESEDKFKRLAADFANYKRRAEAERNEVLELLEARLLNGVLAIYDDFCRLNQHTAGVNEQLAQGLKAVQTKWQNWLAQESVEVINPTGQLFDPHLHDALMQQAVQNAEQDGHVILVIENGYKRKEKVLRHAKVIVGHFEAEQLAPVEIAHEEPSIAAAEALADTSTEQN